MKYITLLLLSVIAISCGTTDNDPQNIVDKAIEKAGGENFVNTEIEFLFRDREYGYKKVNGNYEYVRLFKDSLDVVRDVLTNNSFKREINGVEVSIPDSMAAKYSRSVNSVIYFALLPYGLNDPAVNKDYLELKQINGQDYHKIKVTFNQEGGGEDYEDVFIYWINTTTYEVDFLAYLYYTDGGGMRFREAINPRVINNVRFVDYINYKPKTNIKLVDIDDHFVKGELEELSRIELEKIKVNKL